MVPQPTILAVTAALAGFAAASPVRPSIPPRIPPSIHHKAGSFSLPQVINHFFRPHGPTQLAKTLAKYGVALPDGLARTVAKFDASRLAARDSGSVETTPEQYDIQYLTPVQIGSPPQTLHLDLDSGSSDLWVFSTETPSTSVSGQTLYDPKKSNSSQKVDGASWHITYGDKSSSSGDVYHDTVKVGGITVKGQAVESATQVSAQFTRDSNNDGLLGLAFSTLNTVTPKPELTWFDNAAKTLDAPVWAADLKYHKPGTYDFGKIDKSKYTGEIAYVDVDSSDGFWGFESSGYAIGNGSFTSSPFKGIADTGTTLALIPAAAVEAYYKAVPGATLDATQGGYVFPCDATLPDFVLGVGDAGRIRIPGQYVNYAPADQSGKSCFGGIQSDEDVGFSIIGDAALKAAYVVFDATPGKPRLGWASKAL
ncbi:secreted aspartic proteinase precursor [Nemania sp. FL0916]|nr:secreted aspartic proteinase precursor [Nemania sp. FL0916]